MGADTCLFGIATKILRMPEHEFGKNKKRYASRLPFHAVYLAHSPAWDRAVFAVRLGWENTGVQIL